MTTWLKSWRDFVALIVIDICALITDWREER